MTRPIFSDEYTQLLLSGPFPGQVDPWAEAGRCFRQIHSGMISDMLARLQEPVLLRGSIAARETSLQIMEQGEPDLAIRDDLERPAPSYRWDYAAAAS